MFDNVPVDDQSYLADAFPQARSKEAGLHHSQTGSQPIKCKLMFLVPVEDSDPPFKFISISIPANTPVGRLRLLTAFLEEQLKETYGEVKKLNFVMIKPEDSEAWKLSYTLPYYSVVFV